MKLKVQLAVPADRNEIDMDLVRKVFPYGNLLPIEVGRIGKRLLLV